MTEEYWKKTPDKALRARGLGMLFDGVPGKFNAITDVPSLEIGYETIIKDLPNSKVRTGLTAIHPRGKKNADKFVHAGYFSLSGNGEITGTAWIDESGLLSMPIVLTNTFSVGMCHHSVIAWANENFAGSLADFGSPVVLETYDGILSDINAQVIEKQHVYRALDNAATGPILEGSVGGGTGNIAFSYKAGTGSSSRKVGFSDKEYIIGVLVQANFGRKHELTIFGKKVLELEKNSDIHKNAGDGSCAIVIATDAPMLPLQCKAMAKRASLGIARLGSNARVTSGELFLAFSTAGKGKEVSGVESRYAAIPWQDMTPFYDAVAQAVEEAIINSLVANQSMIGQDDLEVPALPHAALLNL